MENGERHVREYTSIAQEAIVARGWNYNVTHQKSDGWTDTLLIFHSMEDGCLPRCCICRWQKQDAIYPGRCGDTSPHAGVLNIPLGQRVTAAS